MPKDSPSWPRGCSREGAIFVVSPSAPAHQVLSISRPKVVPFTRKKPALILVFCKLFLPTKFFTEEATPGGSAAKKIWERSDCNQLRICHCLCRGSSSITTASWSKKATTLQDGVVSNTDSTALSLNHSAHRFPEARSSLPEEWSPCSKPGREQSTSSSSNWEAQKSLGSPATPPGLRMACVPFLPNHMYWYPLWHDRSRFMRRRRSR
mmetsp:Transcript_61101/g.131423  ORF Transcript_61101/g.131423 Transcript_61101/m.131423 type:complete len:208 (-) Transcript_61101:1589-2212(-)